MADDKKQKRPIYICIEGVDGCGKTTFTNYLEKFLTTIGIKVKRYDFPSPNNGVGRFIIDAKKSGSGTNLSTLPSDLVTSLFTLDRINEVQNNPHGDDCDVVLLCRSYYSNFIYQFHKFGKLKIGMNLTPIYDDIETWCRDQWSREKSFFDEMNDLRNRLFVVILDDSTGQDVVVSNRSKEEGVPVDDFEKPQYSSQVHESMKDIYNFHHFLGDNHLKPLMQMLQSLGTENEELMKVVREKLRIPGWKRELGDATPLRLNHINEHDYFIKWYIRPLVFISDYYKFIPNSDKFRNSIRKPEIDAITKLCPCEYDENNHRFDSPYERLSNFICVMANTVYPEAALWLEAMNKMLSRGEEMELRQLGMMMILDEG